MVLRNSVFPIVAIGASAGGIPALQALFKGIPCPCGMAFVIVTHLNPDRESLLHEVVGRYTDMPVVVAEQGARVEVDTVYVMPPNAILSIVDGAFRVRRPEAGQRERKPVDIFFSSLAKDRGDYAVGIVLSGGDSDGTLGVKAIKEHGGLTLAQTADGSGPRNPDMPRSAISTGVIDLALPAEEMGAKLVQFASGYATQNTPQDTDESIGLQRAQKRIYDLLRSRAGHDFSGYKTKTFLRRVRRRMQIQQIADIDAYAEHLERDPAEVMLLFRDLLINVTSFFRDEAAFDVLERLVVPRLFEGCSETSTIRIWVPGCATGEEVYSIAILMREHMDKMDAPPRIQIFATDIDETALNVSRSARYPETLLENVSEERQRRYFNHEAGSFVVKKDIRELCIFSPHSIVRDPPFSRMDLVSCRNLLIYFGAEIQQHVIPMFHYALRPGGYLFLGMSENIGQYTDLFTTVDKRHRVFQARDHVPRGLHTPFLAGTRPRAAEPRKVAKSQPGGFSLRHRIESRMLEEFVPAHVVTNDEGEVVYYSGNTGDFLQIPQGAPSQQLIGLARKDLRLDLRAALREARERQARVVRDNVLVEAGDDRIQMVSLTVEPVGEGDGLYLVVFTPEGLARLAAQPDDHGSPSRDSVAVLETELRETRDRLQSTIEEYETALEELKSANEELVSVNEEAQSTNEELEASKEEMQSLNEEMNTVNAELSSKIEELDRSNDDLRNLFESSQIATVFLDRNLVIRNFTPAASKFFNLLSSDIGRPLTDLASRLDYAQLREHIGQVFASGEPMEQRIAQAGAGHPVHYLVRLLPYRDTDHKVIGVVVTLLDVTTLVESEEHQKLLVSELNHRVKNMLTVAISLAHQTRKNSGTVEEFSETLTGRLQALARTYGLLTRNNWTKTSLKEVVGAELEPFGLERIKLTGAAVTVSPQTSLSLGMAIHELATNAAKYGALSVPEGTLDVTWRLAENAGASRVQLSWREAGGPKLSGDQESGFGLRLVRGELEHRLDGTLDIRFDRDGLSAELDFPLE